MKKTKILAVITVLLFIGLNLTACKITPADKQSGTETDKLFAGTTGGNNNFGGVTNDDDFDFDFDFSKYPADDMPPVFYNTKYLLNGSDDLINFVYFEDENEAVTIVTDGEEIEVPHGYADFEERDDDWGGINNVADIYVGDKLYMTLNLCTDALVRLDDGSYDTYSLRTGSDSDSMPALQEKYYLNGDKYAVYLCFINDSEMSVGDGNIEYTFNYNRIEDEFVQPSISIKGLDSMFNLSSYVINFGKYNFVRLPQYDDISEFATESQVINADNSEDYVKIISVTPDVFKFGEETEFTVEVEYNLSAFTETQLCFALTDERYFWQGNTSSTTLLDNFDEDQTKIITAGYQKATFTFSDSLEQITYKDGSVSEINGVGVSIMGYDYPVSDFFELNNVSQMSGGGNDVKGISGNEAMELLVTAIYDKMADGTTILCTGNGEVDGRQCYLFAYGDNSQEKFTALEHYAVTGNGEIYIMDYLTGEYNPLAMG